MYKYCQSSQVFNPYEPLYATWFLLVWLQKVAFNWFSNSQVTLNELIQMFFPIEISLWGFLEQKKKKSFLRHSLFYFFFLFKILSQNNLHYINRTFCWFWHRNKMTTHKDACSLQQAGWFLSTCMVLVCLICMESFYFILHFKS